MEVRMKGEEVIVSCRHNKRINMAVRVEGETVIVSFGSDKRIKMKEEEESKALPEHLVSVHLDKCVKMEVRADDEEIIISFGRDKRIKLEVADESTALPEHLVEKIVSRVSFPSLFKFRSLSKAWLARLSSISSRNDDARQRLAIIFQEQVSEFSNSWDTFYPISIGNGNSFVYNRVSHIWRRLPGLSFLPNSLRALSNVLDKAGSAVLPVDDEHDFRFQMVSTCKYDGQWDVRNAVHSCLIPSVDA